MQHSSSRRAFIEAAAGGAIISAWGSLAKPEMSVAAEECTPSDSQKPGQTDSIPIFNGIFPQHVELLLQRARLEQERVAQSLNGAGARPVTVAACQLANHCGGEAGKQANLDRIVRAMQVAADKGAQVLAFPELCLPGYHLKGTPEEAAKISHSLADEAGQGRFIDSLSAAADKLGVVIAFGFCERDGDAFYNSIGLIDADGTWLGSRRKNPLSPHPHETGVFTEPDPSQRSAVFQTRHGTIGLANCFDGEFPESIRRMRLAGAELLLWCNAGTGNPRTGHTSRINASACYAQANRMWVVCCNAVAGDFYGTSVIVGPSGEPLVILPPAEEALGIAAINLAMTSDWERWRDRLDPIWQHNANS